jgi:elongation factor P
MAQITAIELRKGMLIDQQGRPCRITYWNLWKSDRRSRIQLKVKDIISGRMTEITAHGEDKYAVLDSETMDLTYGYKDGNEEVFYTKDGDEHRCPAGGVEDVVRWNSDIYRGLFVDGKLLTVEPPQSVVATVAETSPPIKGIQNGTKDATLDNGITVKVGMGVTVGDKVRIDTETLEFKERVERAT